VAAHKQNSAEQWEPVREWEHCSTCHNSVNGPVAVALAAAKVAGSSERLREWCDAVVACGNALVNSGRYHGAEAVVMAGWSDFTSSDPSCRTFDLVSTTRLMGNQGRHAEAVRVLRPNLEGHIKIF
jgi:hypothetical protein